MSNGFLFAVLPYLRTHDRRARIRGIEFRNNSDLDDLPSEARDHLATLGKMFKFLGLEPPAEDTNEEVRTHVNDKYFEMWRQNTRSMMGKARTRRLIKRYEERCRSFGYSLSILADPASSGRVAD